MGVALGARRPFGVVAEKHPWNLNRFGPAEGSDAVELSAPPGLIRFQIAHSAWALARLIEHARTLPAAEIDRDFGIGPGSLRENIAHTIECMFFFADNFAGLEYVEPAEFATGSKTLDGLSGLLDSAHGKLRLAMVRACERGFGETVKWPNADSGTLPAAAAVAQVFDHSTLHRAQCVNMLKRLGVTPVPDLDPMTYQTMLKRDDGASR